MNLNNDVTRTHIQLGLPVDLTAATNPTTGAFLMAFDLDGVLKKKNEHGVITAIDTATGPTGSTGATGSTGLTGATGSINYAVSATFSFSGTFSTITVVNGIITALS